MADLHLIDWEPFYGEFAKILLAYRDNRRELIQKIVSVYDAAGIPLPTLERNDQIVDIDPFTVFGLFNKKIKKQNRIKIITAVAKLFNVSSPIPDGFGGLPVLNNQSASFYNLAAKENPEHVEILWDLFESALRFDQQKDEENTEHLSHAFNAAIHIQFNGTGKITMGLFWVAPRTFINLDKANYSFIRKSGKIPAIVLEKLPNELPGKIEFTEYLRILNLMKNYISSEESPWKSFPALSLDAWNWSNQNKLQSPSDSPKEIEDRTGSELSEEAVNEEKAEFSAFSSYTKKDFLDEVYMDESTYDDLKNLLLKKKNVILQGAPGVGKTFLAKRLAHSIMGVADQNRVRMVQFHQSYSYEDFVEGFRPSSDGVGFEIKKGVFYNFCKEAEVDPDREYFFIIDEINRGNLSRILGELFMLIENDKRGETLRLIYSDEVFSVPQNLFIIGMMNTADRSLAMIDYALRRRFSFFTMEPAFRSEGFVRYQRQLESQLFDSLILSVEELNRAIQEDRSLGKGFRIGHSYFCGMDYCNEDALATIVQYDILPLLQEYWFDDESQYALWAEKLKDVIHGRSQ